MDDPRKEQDNVPKFRGLYRHVNISVKALDRIIIACILVIIIVVAIELMDPGFTVTFDSRGGTDVAAQELEYGEVILEPQAPTREGYTFAGWYMDEALDTPWDFETPIEGSRELHAAWTPNP